MDLSIDEEPESGNLCLIHSLFKQKIVLLRKSSSESSISTEMGDWLPYACLLKFISTISLNRLVHNLAVRRGSPLKTNRFKNLDFYCRPNHLSLNVSVSLVQGGTWESSDNRSPLNFLFDPAVIRRVPTSHCTQSISWMKEINDC